MPRLLFRLVVGSLLLIAPFAVTAMTGGGSRAALWSPAQPPGLVPSPLEWIPFSADAVIDNEARGMHLVGRHYRASDGSERWEQGRPDVDFISIRHIPSATYYEWRRGNGLRWRVH